MEALFPGVRIMPHQKSQVGLVSDQCQGVASALPAEPGIKRFGTVVGRQLFQFLDVHAVFLVHDFRGLGRASPGGGRNEVERPDQANQSCPLPSALLFSLGG